MAWSYRSDRSDEVYHAPGVTLIEGEKLPHTPRDAEHAQDMLDPKRVEKREKETAAAAEKAAEQAEQQAKATRDAADRQRIRAEEEQKARDAEREKELDKIRKEEADRAKKPEENKTTTSTTHKK